jgi:excisionase family DNA binding protein
MTVDGRGTRTRQKPQVVGRLSTLAVCTGMHGTQPANRELTPSAMDRLLRPDQAAWYLNVKTSWIYEAVRSGRLPCHRVGRHIRFTRPMLDEWLAEQARR